MSMYLNALNLANRLHMGHALDLGAHRQYREALSIIGEDDSADADFIRGIAYLNLGERNRALQVVSN